MSTGRAAHAYAALAFFTLFAGEAIRDALSWYGYAAWAGLVLVGCVVLLVRSVRESNAGRPSGAASASFAGALRALIRGRGARWQASVVLLGAYLFWAIVSLAWSAYPLGTLTGVGALLVVTFVAVTIVCTLPWVEIARALNAALVAILALSLIFEFIVAAIIRRPILPTFPINVVPGQKVPDAFYWSRALLFDGGRIQGIVGNANLLGFIALLAVILGGCLLSARSIPRWLGIAGLVLGVLELALTRSSTIVAATTVTAVVLALTLLLRREPRSTILPRRRIGGGVVALLLVGAVALVIQYRPLLALMGKSDDLTGRFDIWSVVGSLIEQRPVVGWGWIGYWLPWIPPFGHLAERNGVVYLQAHNALLDVVFQLGIIGAGLFIALVVAVAARIAAGRLQIEAQPKARHGTLAVILPALILTALITQSIAESRLLYEGNWAVFCVLTLALGQARLAGQNGAAEDALRVDAGRHPDH